MADVTLQKNNKTIELTVSNVDVTQNIDIESSLGNVLQSNVPALVIGNNLTATVNSDNSVTIQAVASELENTDKSQVTVSDTTTETDLTNYTLSGNKLGSSNILNIESTISNLDIQKNDNITFRIYYGGTSIASATIDNQSGGDLSNHKGRIDSIIIGDGDTSSQRGYISVRAGSGKYEGPNEKAKAAFTGGTGTSSVDSTSDQTVKITAQWNNASSSNSLTKETSFSELKQ